MYVHGVLLKIGEKTSYYKRTINTVIIKKGVDPNVKNFKDMVQTLISRGLQFSEKTEK